MLRWQGTLRTQESSEQDLEHERTYGEDRCQQVLETQQPPIGLRDQPV